VTSIVHQIQASIISEAELTYVSMKEMQQKGKKDTNIQDRISPPPPQTKPYGWQTPRCKLKKAANKTQGVSMAKHILPLKPRQ
jgi:hypothetical protein